MVDIIKCTAVLQPRVFSGDSSEYSVVVSLSFEWRATLHSPSSPEDVPRERFQRFLEALPSAKFDVYRLTRSASSPPRDLEPAEWSVTKVSPASGATPAENIMAWLDRREMTSPDDRASPPRDYWASAEKPAWGSPGRSSYAWKLGQLKGAHYLGTAAAWPAPLAQDAGIVRILTLTPTTISPPLVSPPMGAEPDLSDLVIVPFFEGAGEFNPLAFEHDHDPHDLIRFTYDAGVNFPDAIAELRIVDHDAMNATGLMDIENGFLVAPNDPDDADRAALFIKRIEDRSASLLWVFPAVHSIRWEDVQHSPANAGMARLVWRAMNGLATLLDPVLLSLIMPSPAQSGTELVPNPRGPFVSALTACIEQAWSDHPVGAAPASDTSPIGDLIEQGLSTLLFIQDENNPAAARDSLVSSLVDLFRIKAGGSFDEANPSKTINEAQCLLWLLLKYYGAVPPDQLRARDFSKFLDIATARFGSQGNWSTLEVALSNELGALAQQLQADDRVEQLAMRLLEKIGLLDDSGGNLSRALRVDADIARDGIARFRRLLTPDFNALDALRHAQGRLYELHLVATASARRGAKRQAEVVERWTSQDLTDAMHDARWFERRVDPAVASTLSEIGKILPIYAASALAMDDCESVARTLARAFDVACEELLPGEQQRRFVPDHVPKPLEVQIAVDSDLTHLENFSHAYSGFGILIRSVGKPWAYADLSELNMYACYDASKKTDIYYDVKEPGFPGLNLITLLPLQQFAIDDQYRLFVSYNGDAFTSQAFAETGAPFSGENGAQPPFYEYDHPAGADLTAAGFTLSAALAYGTIYEAAAFAIGKGGGLPSNIQASGVVPWKPSHAPQVPPDTGARMYARRYEYKRTTAVGRITLNESGNAKRIGADISGVQPLFHDYPRVGLIAPQHGSSVLDILRNADGTGAFSLPQAGATSSPPVFSPPVFSPPVFSPPHPGKAKTSIVLQDLWWWGEKGELTVSVFAGSAVRPTDPPKVSWAFAIEAPFAGARLSLEISADGPPDHPTGSPDDQTFTFSCRLSDLASPDVVRPPTPGESQVIDAQHLDGAESIWLRLNLSAQIPGKSVALSFADPGTTSGDHVTSRPAGDSLVLIAPERSPSEWRVPYAERVEANVIFPRVGFNDFDRWLNNPHLADESMASIRGQPPTSAEKARFRAFRLMLLTAYGLRHLNANLGPLLDNLPDLSVDQLLVELTPLDALYDEPPNVVSQLRTGVTSAVVPLKSLGARLLELTLVDPPHVTLDDLPDVGEIVKRLTTLSRICSMSLDIASSDNAVLSITSGPGKANGPETVLTATLPRGMVARLTIRPMVHESRLMQPASPPGIAIFDERIATLAPEKRDHYYVFEGASVIVESMLGALAAKAPVARWQAGIEPGTNRSYDWENLVAKAVVVRAAGSHRSYDIVAQPSGITTVAMAWRWRQLANIDVTTQRWRFTGRPIYSWLDPKKNAPGSSNDVAIEQTWSQDDNGSTLRAITRFESESFFDRDDADADSRATRLSPAPHETVLQSFPWEQPSATYFRHRLTIRSRYEGALRPGNIVAQRAWGEDDDFNHDASRKERFGKSWIRVAMLADRTRLQLTRPQLRALIPLTTAPTLSGNETQPAAPPVMAVLDERPFAHGGLADRIAAEIRTGFGYELPSDTPLRIADARKEFGPDPRLSYTPTEAGNARALTLRNEGPVGLTFDIDTVRASVFANTALVLHPMLLTRKGPPPASMEEHFLSVGLRRYLDPAWLTGEGADGHSIDNSWWITWRMGKTDQFSLGVEGGPQGRDLIFVTEENGLWTVYFDAALIDALPQDAWASPPAHSAMWDSPQWSPPPLSPTPDFKKLCAVYGGGINGLAFLHLPLEKGRASLSVFAQPSGISATGGDLAILAGEGNQPLMMASIEWQVPVGAGYLRFDDDGRTSARQTSASPTTLMNWTRTGRNFELWCASKGGSFASYYASDLTVRWIDKDNGQCAFFDASDRGEDEPLTLGPRSSRYPNPLYVHRHHAIIPSRNAPGLGRPIELPGQAQRTFGGLFTLPVGTEAVRLVEFETPARPLAWFSSTPASAPLTHFQTAHFDLVSIWNKGAATDPGSPSSKSTPPGFSLFIRPLGGDAMNTRLTELTLQLSFSPTSTGSTVKLTLTRPTKPVRGIILIARSGGIQFDLASVSIDEELHDATVVPHSVEAPPSDVSAVELSISNVTVNGGAPPEFWADVSLLTLPRSEALMDAKQLASKFTFDWFFTGNRAESSAEAIKPAALREMIEAQARIIAVSPAIVVGS